MGCNYHGNCGSQVGGVQTYPCRAEMIGVKRALMALERCLIESAQETPTPTPPSRPCRCRCRCCCCCCCRCCQGGSGTGNQTTWGR